MANANQTPHREFKLSTEVKDFLKMEFKKFKKKNKDYFGSKKELKEAYFAEVVDKIPEVTKTLVRYGYVEKVREVKGDIYNIIEDEKLIKTLTKMIKKEYVDVVEYELLPNVIFDMIKEIAKQTAEATEAGKEVEMNVEDLVELSQLILKKKLKKMEKAGIPADIAFDVLSIIPTASIVNKSAYHHLRNLFISLYEHAKTKEVNFEKIIKILFDSKNDLHIFSVISFALLERKEKIGQYDANQQKLFTAITDFCIKYLEDSSKDEILSVLKGYIKSRKNDAKQGKDTARRFYLSSLPENDYPKILKAIERLIKEDEENAKYL